MEILRNIDQAAEYLAGGSVLTIGTYDGFHIGHAVIINNLISIAKDSGLKSTLITFAPHPKQVVAPDQAPQLLTTTEEKLALLKRTDLDAVVIVEFTPEFAAMAAADFLKDYLVGKYSCRHVVIGYNHAFGRQREGDINYLKENATKYGYKVSVNEPIILEGEPVHSSRIRKEMLSGEFNLALKMLGHEFEMKGKVVQGKGLGTKLGYPTINVQVPPEKIIPAPGVYATHVTIDNEERFGMMYIGESGEPFAFEVNLFDFTGDLYGKTVKVLPTKFIRQSIRFGDSNDLINQIERDEKKIRKILKQS